MTDPHVRQRGRPVGGGRQRRADPPEHLLIDAWYGSLTAVELIVIFGIPQVQLYRCWQDLRKAGKLPARIQRHTPHHAELAKMRKELAGNVDALPSIDDAAAAAPEAEDDDDFVQSVAVDKYDGRPKIVGDRLLEALRREHGDAGRADLWHLFVEPIRA